MKNKTQLSGIFSRIFALICVVMFAFTVSGCSDSDSSDAIENSGVDKTWRYDIVTPRGSSVEAWTYNSDYTDAKKQQLISSVEYNYPNARALREPTTMYNCHSYAWYSSGSDNTVWIPDPTAYWADGSYTKITTITSNYSTIPSTIPYSAKIVWYDNDGPSHSARKYSATEVVSKWGGLGLYVHNQGYSPYTDDTIKIEYYK